MSLRCENKEISFLLFTNPHQASPLCILDATTSTALIIVIYIQPEID